MGDANCIAVDGDFAKLIKHRRRRRMDTHVVEQQPVQTRRYPSLLLATQDQRARDPLVDLGLHLHLEEVEGLERLLRLGARRHLLRDRPVRRRVHVRDLHRADDRAAHRLAAARATADADRAASQGRHVDAGRAKEAAGRIEGKIARLRAELDDAVYQLFGAREIYDSPRHPYTKALLSAVPRISAREGQGQRIVLGGDVPSPISPPSGCPFHPRCPIAEDRCKTEVPEFRDDGAGHSTACHLV